MAKTPGFNKPASIDPAVAAQIMAALGQSGTVFNFDYGENAADPDWGRKPPKLKSLQEAVQSALNATEPKTENATMPGMTNRLPGVRGTQTASPRQSSAYQSGSQYGRSRIAPGVYNSGPGGAASQPGVVTTGSNAGRRVPMPGSPTAPSPSRPIASSGFWSGDPSTVNTGIPGQNTMGGGQQPSNQNPSVYGQPGTGQSAGGGNTYAPPPAVPGLSGTQQATPYQPSPSGFRYEPNQPTQTKEGYPINWFGGGPQNNTGSGPALGPDGQTLGTGFDPSQFPVGMTPPPGLGPSSSPWGQNLPGAGVLHPGIPANAAALDGIDPRIFEVLGMKMPQSTPQTPMPWNNPQSDPRLRGRMTY